MRVFTLAFALLFGANASYAATGLKASLCAKCRPDCPMHKPTNKLKCHGAAKGDHCHRKASKRSGLYAGGCESRPDGFAASDPPSLPNASMDLAAPVLSPAGWSEAPGEAALGVDPTPWHPPSLVSVGS